MWEDRNRVIEIEASKWQARLKLKGKRKDRKRGALIFARAAIGALSPGGPLTDDSADAICMGLVAVRRMKESELLEGVVR